MKNKSLRRRFGSWWETLFGYDLDIVYRTGQTNSADSLSRRPDYKAVAEAKDHRKQAEKPTEDSPEGARCSAAESEKGCEEVAHISMAQLLGPWEQRLAATVRYRLPMATQGSPGNANRLFTTVIGQEEEKDQNNSKDL